MVDYSTAQHLASGLVCIFRFPNCELPQKDTGRDGDDKDSGGLVSLELFCRQWYFPTCRCGLIAFFPLWLSGLCLAVDATWHPRRAYCDPTGRKKKRKERRSCRIESQAWSMMRSLTGPIQLQGCGSICQPFCLLCANFLTHCTKLVSRSLFCLAAWPMQSYLNVP